MESMLNLTSTIKKVLQALEMTTYKIDVGILLIFDIKIVKYLKMVEVL